MHVTGPETPTAIDVARVVVPFVPSGITPGTLWALQEAGVEDYDLVDVSADDEAYFDLLTTLWATGESFTLVEQDIAVRPDTLAGFDDCPKLWCVAKYGYLGGSYWGLGATRFRGPLLKEFPDLMDDVGRYITPTHTARHWCILDQAITNALRARRMEWPHIHGEVTHLSDGWPSHQCRPHPVGS